MNSPFLSVFEKEIVCPSVCLAFFVSADARDLGLMTLLVTDLGFVPPSVRGSMMIESKSVETSFK